MRAVLPMSARRASGVAAPSAQYEALGLRLRPRVIGDLVVRRSAMGQAVAKSEGRCFQASACWETQWSADLWLEHAQATSIEDLATPACRAGCGRPPRARSPRGVSLRLRAA